MADVVKSMEKIAVVADEVLNIAETKGLTLGGRPPGIRRKEV